VRKRHSVALVTEAHNAQVKFEAYLQDGKLDSIRMIVVADNANHWIGDKIEILDYIIDSAVELKEALLEETALASRIET
jgi:hypothetical protein